MISQNYTLLTYEDVKDQLVIEIVNIIELHNITGVNLDPQVMERLGQTLIPLLNKRFKNMPTYYSDNIEFINDYQALILENIDLFVKAQLVINLEITLDKLKESNTVSTQYGDNRNIDKLFSSTIENFRKSADTPTEIEAIQDFVDSYTNFQEKVKTKNDVTKDNTKDDRTGNITQNNKSPFAELYTNIYALKFNYINDIVSVISELFFTVYNYEEDIYDC